MGRLPSYSSPGRLSLLKVSIDGGEPVLLTDKFIVRPAISPDGKLIAGWYGDDEDALRRMAIIPFAGEQAVKIFDVPSWLTIPGPNLLPLRWTPDGSGLTYAAVSGGSAAWRGVANIWSQPLTGGKPVQLTNFQTDTIYSFDWALDGRLVLSRGSESNDVVLIKDLK